MIIGQKLAKRLLGVGNKDACYNGDQVKKIERDVADMNAIASVPELIAELKRCYELIDELETPSHEDERYPEPDERTPPNTTRAGADWPSGPRM